MRLLFFCLMLALGSLQLSAAHSVSTLPEVYPEHVVEATLTSTTDINVDLLQVCCTAESGDTSVRVCLSDGDIMTACSAAAIGLGKVLDLIEK